MTSPAQQPLATRYATRSLVVLFAINILNFYDRAVVGAVIEPVRKEFGLSDTQIGAITTAFTLLYAVIGVPLGRLADRWSRKKLLASGITVWSLLTALTALATSYSLLVFTRLGVAVGEAVCAPVSTSWLGDLFPANKRARALGIFMLGVPIGTACSNFFSGPIAQAYGWRSAMIVAAVPALFLIPALITLHEPIRGASELRAQTGAESPVWTILRIPTLWWIIASGAILNFIMYANATFLASLLMRVHGLSMSRTGIASGLVYIVGGVAGGLAGGRIGDWVVSKRKDGRMLTAALAALSYAPLAYFGIIQTAGATALALPLLGLAYGCLNMYYGLVYSSIQDIVRPALRGTTMAFYFMVMYLGGAAFGSVITGGLSDRMARQAAIAAGSPVITEAAKAIGLQQAMLILPALAVALALVLWAGSRTIEGDMRRV